MPWRATIGLAFRRASWKGLSPSAWMAFVHAIQLEITDAQYGKIRPVRLIHAERVRQIVCGVIELAHSDK